MYRSSSVTTIRQFLSYDAFAVQRTTNVLAGSGVFSPTNGTYLMSISSASLYRSSASVGLYGIGDSTVISNIITNTEAVNGIITTSNTFVLSVNPNYFFILTTIQNLPYSDILGKQTSWSALRLEDFLNPIVAFSASAIDQSYVNPTAVNYSRPALTNIGGAWRDDGSNTFTATATGVYVFSHTVSMRHGNATCDMIINVGGSTTFELVRTVTSIADSTTIGLTFAVSLAAGVNVTILVSGEIGSLNSIWSG